jgi:DNA-directed RNA polymerase subunit RPC12/RpoP
MGVVIEGALYEVPACLKCSGPMLDDSRTGGMKCVACGHEEVYKKQKTKTKKEK